MDSTQTTETGAIPRNGNRALVIVFNCLLVLSCMERFYSPGRESGVFNAYICAAYALVGVVYCLSHASSVKYSLNDILWVGVALYFLAWSFESDRALLYALTVFALLVLGKLGYLDLRLAHRLLVIIGAACCLVFCIGSARWTGFLNTSAPVFSLIMLTSLAYLLYGERSSKIDYALAFVALVMIAFTQTRVPLLVGVVIFIAKFFGRQIGQLSFFLARHKVIAIILVVAVVALIAYNYQALLDIFGRSDGDDSTRTRMGLMSGVIDQWLSSPEAFLLGNGGGYAMRYTAIANSGFAGHLPVHQDVLMLLCDYGLVGFGMFLAVLWPLLKKWPWFCLLILIAATFHNVFTSGTAFFIMFLTFQSLGAERYRRQSGGAS